MALAGAGHVDLIAGFKNRNPDGLTDLVLGGVLQPELTQVTDGRDAGLFEVARVGLVHQLLRALFVHRVKADLDGLIAILFNCFLLHHGAWACEDHSDRHQAAVGQEFLRHAQLFA